MITAEIATNKGSIHLDLFAEQAPVTVANFVNLAQRGYYDGLSFHRVIDDFMVQAGCPSGTGAGGPGYRFEDECSQELKHDGAGMLSMANAGPGTNGSQFFITHLETPWLDGKHTVFGRAKSPSDIEVVNAIKQGDTITQVTITGDIEPLLSKMANRLAEWDEILNQNFPELK